MIKCMITILEIPKKTLKIIAELYESKAMMSSQLYLIYYRMFKNTERSVHSSHERSFQDSHYDLLTL